MNVLHIISSMDPRLGGVCQALKTLAGRLVEKGVYCEIASLDDPYQPFLSETGVRINALGPAKSPWQYSSRFVPWLNKNLGRFNVVVLHGLWLYSSYAAYRAVRLFNKRNQIAHGPSCPKVRFYVMPHGMLDPYFQKAPERRLKAIRNYFYYKLIEQKVINKADEIFFASAEECRLAATTFKPYHPRRTRIIGLGIEPPPASTLQMQLAFAKLCPNLGKSPYLLYLGRIHEKKGLDLLIHAYANHVRSAFCYFQRCTGILAHFEQPVIRMKDKFEKSVLHLVVAGPGLDSAYGRYILDLLSRRPELKGLVHFPGMLTHDAKWGAFYGCEAFVLTSHQENFGIAIVEALACAKPVLISDQVNIWKEVKASGGGLITQDTLMGVHHVLQQWTRLSKTAKLKVSRQARLTYLKNFSVDGIANRLIEAWKNDTKSAW